MTRRNDQSQPSPLSHAKQREIIRDLSNKGLSVAQICEYSGLTRLAAEHHLWFLEHLRQQGREGVSG